ncbi:hypothetical protein F0L17_24785 [Streptomyces sp. TRM43335]|uniref:Uncharacterized protein n=1 Tax=Streptomyces taklimakanensis TaxID=2569853 RepID=A0A6G2BJK9_9ACTN|nr:hypothetical protein [Streptomyces taklimakanensis]MTE22259.1 hypothetical protein [Streptomyces taklimakanensis]
MRELTRYQPDARLYVVPLGTAQRALATGSTPGRLARVERRIDVERTVEELLERARVRYPGRREKAVGKTSPGETARAAATGAGEAGDESGGTEGGRPLAVA